MMILSCVFAAVLSAGNAEFERSSNEMAAEISFARLRTEAVEKGLQSSVLQAKMLADPASFRSRAEAEKLCHEFYSEALKGYLESEAKKIEERLDLSSTGVAARVGWVDEAARHATETRFARAFENERRAACAEQAKRIALKVKPAETELESENDAEIRARLVRRVAEAAGFVVFDENQGYISEKIVDPLLADARKEQKRQQEYLMRTRCDAYAPSALARELEANLRKNVEERQSKCDDPLRAWGVFPKTLVSALPPAVERRLIALAAKRVNEVPLTVDEQMVRTEIERDRVRHRKAKDSEAVCLEMYSMRVMQGAVEKAILDAPSAEREEFAAYVRAHANSAELKKEAESRLRREVLPMWRMARREIAKKETARLWPTLVERTWFPSADLADQVLARSDAPQVLQNWRASKDFASLKAEALLEESDRAADESIVRAFDLARRAMAAQNESVERAHPAILNEVRDRAHGFFSSTPDLKKVIELLTSAVEEDWNAHRVGILWPKGDLPSNADEQHVELFPSVRKHIELLARQILEEFKKEEESSDSTDDSSENSDANNELCTIEFELGGSEVTVRAKRGERVIAERQTKATARNFEEAVREVGAIVGQKVLRLK